MTSSAGGASPAGTYTCGFSSDIRRPYRGLRRTPYTRPHAARRRRAPPPAPDRGPRGRAGRRLVLAPQRRPQRSRGPRPARGRERVRRRLARPHRRPAGRALQGDEGAHQGDRPLGAVPQGRALVLQPHRGGPAVPDPVPHRRSSRRPTSPRTTSSPASRCCSTSTCSPATATTSRSGAYDLAPGQDLLLYSTDHDGSERYTMRVRDLRTGADLDDVIPDTSYGIGVGGRHDRSSTCAPTPRCGRTRCGATRSARRRTTTCSCTRTPTSASSSASGSASPRSGCTSPRRRR